MTATLSADYRLGIAAARTVCRAYFEDVQVKGSFEPDAPALVFANHTCAWDATLGLIVTAANDLEFRLFAHEHVMRRHPSFRRLGLIGISRNDPLAAVEVLRSEAAALTTSTRTALWIYPEGGHGFVRQTTRVERGVLSIAHLAPNVQLYSASFRFTMYRGLRPWLWVLIRPQPSGMRHAGELAEAMRRESEALDEALLSARPEFTSVYPGSRNLLAGGVVLRESDLNRAIAASPLAGEVRVGIGNGALSLIGPSLTESLREQLTDAALRALGPDTANAFDMVMRSES